jgi:shikimate kinase
MIFLYGPPGSGKSSIAHALADALEYPFWDLDGEIEAHNGATIPEMFEQMGESGFRQQEGAALSRITSNEKGVVALGGGALLDPQNRAMAESKGVVICLNADIETLLHRVQEEQELRPLLSGDIGTRLRDLLVERTPHYASFPIQLDTSTKNVAEAVWEAQVCLGMFRIRNMGGGYDVRVQQGGLDRLGELLAQMQLGGPIMLVSDTNIAHRYAERILNSIRGAGYTSYLTTIPSGEGSKYIQQAIQVWGEVCCAQVWSVTAR